MPDSPPPPDKSALRRRARREIEALGDDRIATASGAIRSQILSSPLWSPDSCLLVFAALAGEPDLVPLLTAAADGGPTLVFPRVAVSRSGEPALTLHAVTDLDEFARHPRLGIHEPDPSRCPEVPDGDVIAAFVPGLAFDPSTGVRLGRGGGYYDRLLARPGFRALRVGTCFSAQLMVGIPRAPHDKPMGCLLTEAGWITPDAAPREGR